MWELTDGYILRKDIYTRFAYPGRDHPAPRAVGVTGLVTGYAQNADDPDTTIAFIYDPKRGRFTDITFPGMSGWDTAQGINARGQVVGNVTLDEVYACDGLPPGKYGFVREPTGSTTLFRVSDQHTSARGINDAGIIAGFTNTPPGPLVGFLGRLASLGGCQAMTDVEIITVPFPGVTETGVSSIDNSGGLVGFFSDPSNPYRCFIATPLPKGRQ